MAMKVIVGKKKRFYQLLKCSLITIPLIVIAYWVLSIIYGIATFKRPNNANFKMPATVLVYNKTFAQRFGLDESRAINLDPGVEAMSLTFKKDNQYIFEDIFLDKKDLGKFNGADLFVQDDLGPILSIIFKNDPSLPYDIGNIKVYLNVYFDNTNPQVKQLRFPQQRIWNDIVGKDDLSDKFDEMASKPIYWPLLSFPYKRKTMNDIPMDDKNLRGYLSMHHDSFTSNTILVKSTHDFMHESKECCGSSIGYQLLSTIMTNIVPGLTFVSYEIDEFELSNNYTKVVDKNGSWLWIQKIDAPYDKNNPDDEADHTTANFNRFRIPPEITQAPAIQAVMRFNMGQTILP